ncbi:MAG: helix-turn-helix domain-containing protein, partial [Candidatus Methylumidiphilus sp.]
MADKLTMSVNGYGDIERGLSDIKLTRLERIAEFLDAELSELFEDGSKNTLNMMGEHSTGTVHNHGVINTLSPEYSELKSEFEKLKLVCSNRDREVEMKDQEINYLKDIIEVFKNAGWSHPV